MHLETKFVATSQGRIFVRYGGAGPPLLLLHGFPQTGLMWRNVAEQLATDFFIVVPDLPGYGASDCPPDSENHLSMSKRAIAAMLQDMMASFGHSRFFVAGHDRGGRVAYRLALDAPKSVAGLAVLDVIPTLDVWKHADADLMLAFWPFTLLAQAHPLPERLILGDPAALVENALSNWGTPASTFDDEDRRAYIDALSDAERVHCICEEYRAAAGVDREHDATDLSENRRISCPILVLWSAKGGLANWYAERGGPLGIWRAWADDVEGRAIEAGHFFVEEAPTVSMTLLREFFSQHSS